MRQEIVAQKVLGELVDLGLVREQDEDIFWAYLHCVWAAGYDEGRLQYTKRKPVVQLERDGVTPVKVWNSCVEAARFFSMNKTSISKAALGKTKSGISAGFRWKYVEDDGKNYDSSESDGAGD